MTARKRALRSSLQSPAAQAIISAHVGNLYRFRSLLTTIQALKIMMRDFASLLFRLPTMALCGSRRVRSRHDETEFPMASQNAGNLLEWTFRGRRAADRASSDALRPLHHWVNKEDQYELSFIRETPAPAARRISTQGRWPRALSRSARKNAQENILAANRGVFWKRKKHAEAGHGGAQWCATFAAFPIVAQA